MTLDNRRRTHRRATDEENFLHMLQPAGVRALTLAAAICQLPEDRRLAIENYIQTHLWLERMMNGVTLNE